MYYTIRDYSPPEGSIRYIVSVGHVLTTAIYGDRCFATAGLSVWNSLPLQLRQQDVSFERIKTLLKTFCLGDGHRGALSLVIKSAVYKYAYKKLRYLLLLLQ